MRAPVYPHVIRAVTTGRIVVESDIGDFYETLPRKTMFDYNRTKIPGTLREDLNVFHTVGSDNTENALLCFHGKDFNIQYIADRDTCVSNTKRKHCCFAMVEMVTRTHLM